MLSLGSMHALVVRTYSTLNTASIFLLEHISRLRVSGNFNPKLCIYKCTHVLVMFVLVVKIKTSIAVSPY